MRVLVGCEFSGVVRDEFIKRGHDAWSCDILPSETNQARHIQKDVRTVLTEDWDLGIFFPPCTHLCVSGARWFKNKKEEHQQALDFVSRLLVSHIKHICIDNQVGVISTKIRKPDQIIQPYQFGHGEQKTTCLWLKHLPVLKPTKIVSGREQRIWKLPPSPNRGMERSRTFQGIAEAMAHQWGTILES